MFGVKREGRYPGIGNLMFITRTFLIKVSELIRTALEVKKIKLESFNSPSYCLGTTFLLLCLRFNLP